MVANLDGVEPDDIEIGMALRAEFVDFDDELSLPVFVPPSAAEGGLMDFALTDEQLAVSEAATGLFSGLVDPERGRRGRGERRRASTASCGRRWPRPTCSAWPCPSPTAAPATA